MIPVLFIIPKFSILTLVILIFIAAIIFSFIFFLLRKKADSVKQLIKNLLGYYFFLIIILTLLHFLGPFGLPAYGAMLATGFMCAIFTSRRFAQGINVDPDVFFDIFIYIFIGTITGLRLFYVLFYDWANFIRNPLIIFEFWKGGLVLYGGLIGGITGGVFYMIKKGLPLFKMIDIYGVVIPIGIIFGRWGCMGYGCCYGKIAPNWFPFTIRFPSFGINSVQYTPAFEDHLIAGLVQASDKFCLPLYPAQIISSINGLFLFILLWFLYKKRKFDGQIFSLFLMFYAVTRFLIEFIRVEPSWLGLNVSQWIGLLSFTAGLVLYRYAKKRSMSNK